MPWYAPRLIKWGKNISKKNCGQSKNLISKRDCINCVNFLKELKRIFGENLHSCSIVQHKTKTCLRGINMY